MSALPLCSGRGTHTHTTANARRSTWSAFDSFLSQFTAMVASSFTGAVDEAPVLLADGSIRRVAMILRQNAIGTVSLIHGKAGTSRLPPPTHAQTYTHRGTRWMTSLPTEGLGVLRGPSV